MRSPASNHSEAHGRAWARPICGSMGCRAPASNHHQVPPARQSSGAPTGRRIAVGRFYSDISQVREVMAREHTGLLPEVIRAVVEFFPERQVAAADPLHHVLQDTADAAKVVHVVTPKPLFDGTKPIEERGQGRVTVRQARVIPRQGGERHD